MPNLRWQELLIIVALVLLLFGAQAPSGRGSWPGTVATHFQG